MMSRKTSSEVHAYSYILDELKNKKGWGKDQIFTQQECHHLKAIAEQLNRLTPENVVKINEKVFYIIESKNERNKINQAIKEARDYANLVNKSKAVKALFITGIAGNDKEGFIGKSQFFKNNGWADIKENEVEVTSLLSKQQIEKIMASNDPLLKDVEINDAEFLKSAEDINGILHEGGINKDYRARVISAILLALAEGTEINLDENPTVLISSINSRVDLLLRKHNKSEFARFIKIELPSSEDNHNKFKSAIVLTIQELLSLNIRSAMKSGNDVLGKFYEVFLKYGNGAKEIGIVLTPRHITKFAAEVLDVKSNDLVLDPTCGTGGFLVAAFDKVKKETNSKNDFENFKLHGLYGVEQQDSVVSLALVNMIFRGDGKNNIIEGDCFAKWLAASRNNSHAEYLPEDKKGRVPPITKVLMNPPFPKKKTDTKEFLFIEHALKQMQDGASLFSVLPYSCMIKGGGYLKWRQRLLQKNTLLSVVTFPEDLFYPVGVHTLGIFIKKGVPHNEKQKTLWFRALNDGRWKKKGKRLEHPKAKDDYIQITPILKEFIKNQRMAVKAIVAFQKATEIDFLDQDLELVPEAYLDEPTFTSEDIQKDIEQLIRDDIAFHVKFENKLKGIE